MTVQINLWQMLFMLLAWGMVANLVVSLLHGLTIGLLTIRRLHQIPCSRCRFFANSPYLKCPVHPTIALSSQAIDCRDFE